MIERLTHPDPKIRGHLIVPTAPRVQLAPRVADQLHQSRFDKRVNVFGHGFHGWAIFENGFQSGSNLSGFRGAHDSSALERRAPGNTRPHVNVKQPPIETKRTVEFRELR